MITAAELTSAGIPVSEGDQMGAIRAIAALEWVQENTTLEVDMDDAESIKALPATAKLFVAKFSELLSATQGVTSQRIDGLSMDFDTGDKATAIWQLAYTLLFQYIKSQVQATPARRRY